MSPPTYPPPIPTHHPAQGGGTRSEAVFAVRESLRRRVPPPWAGWWVGMGGGQEGGGTGTIVSYRAHPQPIEQRRLRQNHRGRGLREHEGRRLAGWAGSRAGRPPRPLGRPAEPPAAPAERSTSTATRTPGRRPGRAGSRPAGRIAHRARHRSARGPPRPPPPGVRPLLAQRSTRTRRGPPRLSRPRVVPLGEQLVALAGASSGSSAARSSGAGQGRREQPLEVPDQPVDGRGVEQVGGVLDRRRRARRRAPRG